MNSKIINKDNNISTIPQSKFTPILNTIQETSESTDSDTSDKENNTVSNIEEINNSESDKDIENNTESDKEIEKNSELDKEIETI